MECTTLCYMLSSQLSRVTVSYEITCKTFHNNAEPDEIYPKNAAKVHNNLDMDNFTGLTN